MLPKFLIIGTQKGGTTALFEMLSQHPGIAPSKRKEVHFFDHSWEMGVVWYRSFFSSVLTAWRHRQKNGYPLVAGEASPYYLLHPIAPTRAAAVVPNAKIIVLLRDPVDRAYSQYRHQLRSGRTRLSFMEALERETLVFEKEMEKMTREPGYFSRDLINYSYCGRGVYQPQLERWMAKFPPENVLILQSEEFRAAPEKTMAEAVRFLGLPEYNFSVTTAPRIPGYPPMGLAIRDHLARFFAPHNKTLYAFLERDFGWQ